MSATYSIDLVEPDGVSHTNLKVPDDHNGYGLLTEVLDKEPTGTILVPLGDLARLGRVAQAILDGRNPSKKNFDNVTLEAK